MELLDALPVSLLGLLFLVGMAFIAGFVDSIAGGGGLIALPATLLVGIPPHACLGTNKFMCSFGTAAACINYARSGAVVWRVVFIGIGFSLLGSTLGTKAVLFVDTNVLGKVMLVLLPIAAASTFMPIRKELAGRDIPPLLLYIGTPLVCLAIGFYDGFFGPGTGSFLLLGLHFALGMNLVAASATAKPFNLASNVGALVVFIVNGQVLYLVGIPMALANTAGNLLGSRMALKKGSDVVRKMLVVSLALLFATLVWRYYA